MHHLWHSTIQQKKRKILRQNKLNKQYWTLLISSFNLSDFVIFAIPKKKKERKNSSIQLWKRSVLTLIINTRNPHSVCRSSSNVCRSSSNSNFYCWFHLARWVQWLWTLEQPLLSKKNTNSFQDFIILLANDLGIIKCA